MRIIARLIVGGPTIHVMTLTEGLDPSRFSTTLVVGRENRGERSVVSSVRARGLRLCEVDGMVGELSVKPRDARALLALCRLMGRERPDIVHTHTAKAGVLGRLAATISGVPIIVHTYHGHILHGYFPAHINVALRAMERWLARRTQCIVAVSGRIRDDLLRYRIAAPSKIRVVPLGIPLEPFTTLVRGLGDFRREMGTATAQPLIGIVGRIVPIKDHQLFLRALRLVVERRPEARGVVVGDGPGTGQARADARALGIEGRVIFAGWRMDLPRIYADLDALVVSSRNEGTPVSIIEAMAAGCPVVATAVGGVPDMITDGATGRLVRPGDSEALARAILDTLGDGEGSRRMTARARAEAMSRYGAGRLVGDIERLYGELGAAKSGLPQVRPAVQAVDSGGTRAIGVGRRAEGGGGG
jgi:glycosyltransferase involved in cell wall biosynthesis